MRVKSPLKVVTLGAGYFSQFHYDAWHRLEAAQVTGICDRNLPAAIEIGEKYAIPVHSENLEDLIKRLRPDLIDIITPPQTHVGVVEIAAAAGIDVIIQKPFGENLEQARHMTERVEKAGTKLIVHENFRFMPWYREIRTLIDNGTLGEILHLQFNLRPGDGQGKNAYLDRQPYFQSMEKFLVHETAIHLIDTFRFLLGEMQSVYADLRRCNPVIKGEDAGIVVFGMKGNLRAVFDGNRLLDHRAKNRRLTMGEMHIEGTSGSLRLDGDGRIWYRDFATNSESEHDYAWNDANFGGDCVYKLIEHVVNHYQHGAPLENQGFEYLQNIAIEEAIYQSSRQARRIDL